MMAQRDTGAYSAADKHSRADRSDRVEVTSRRRTSRHAEGKVTKRVTRPGMSIEPPAPLPAEMTAERNAAALRYLTRTGNLDVAAALGLVDQVDTGAVQS